MFLIVMYVCYEVFSGSSLRFVLKVFSLCFRYFQLEREGPNLIAPHLPTFSALCDFGICSMILLHYDTLLIVLKFDEWMFLDELKMKFWDVTCRVVIMGAWLLLSFNA